MTHEIKIQEQHFTLHPSGAMFWKEESLLLISDVHLGKVSHFRKFGAAVPQGAVHANFRELNEAVHYFEPECICFLGDLFHSYLNKEWQFFEVWVSKITSRLILVTGNHDIISPLKYEALNIQLVPELRVKNFLFTHHPDERTGLYNFCGHIHPAIKIRGNGKQSLRFPCFFKSEHQLILPAFGAFTGTHTLRPKKKDEIFALADSKVVKI